MNIFLNNFKRVVQKNLEIDYKSAQNTHLKLKNFQKLYDINDSRVFYRFPKKELATILRQECPIPNEEIVNNNQQILENDIYRKKKINEIKTTMKKLRYVQEVSEEHVCSKCSKANMCKVANVVPENVKKTQFSDLLFVLESFAGYAEKQEQLIQEQKQRQEELLKEQQQKELEEEQNQEEEEDYRDNPLEKLEEQLMEEKNKKKKAKEDQQKTNDNNNLNINQEDIYSFKVWSSALKLVDTCDVIMQDLQHHNGIETKKFSNLVQEETYKNFKKMKEFQKEQKQKTNKNQKSEKKTKKSQDLNNQSEDFVKSPNKSQNNNQNKNQQKQKYNHEEYKKQKQEKIKSQLQNKDLNIEDIQQQALGFDKFMNSNKKSYKITNQEIREQPYKNQNQTSKNDNQNNSSYDKNIDPELMEQTTFGENLKKSNRQDKKNQYIQNIKDQKEQEKQHFESIENDNLLLREIDYKKQKGGRNIKQKGFKFTKTKK